MNEHEALFQVLDSMGALGGSWHELLDHGFSEQEAKEICALIEPERYRTQLPPSPDKGREGQQDEPQTTCTCPRFRGGIRKYTEPGCPVHSHA